MSDEENIKFNATTRLECKTGGKQLVRVSCRPGDEKKIEQCLKGIKSIEVPVTGRVDVVGHGGYGKCTRFDIEQHKYVGSGYPSCGGYVEVLEIKNSIEERCSIVIHKWESGVGSIFYEFASLNAALKIWKNLQILSDTKALAEKEGFIRCVACGLLSPWFFAVGNQAICGDFAFPDHLDCNDPVYWPNRKVVLTNYGGSKEIKTCLGVSFESHENLHGKASEYKVVQFSDGTTRSEHSSHLERIIKPLEEESLWKQEAINRVRELLNGELDKATVILLDGKKITIEVEETNKPIDFYFKTGKQQDLKGESLKQVFVIESDGKTFVGNQDSLKEREED